MEVKSQNLKNLDVVYTVKYVLNTTLDDVRWVTEVIKNLMPINFSEENRYFVELGIAEVLTNIVQHGHAGQEFGLITIFLEEQTDCLQVNILDMGLPIPKNLLVQEIKNTLNFDNTDISGLPINGFGLDLIRNIFNVVNYYRIGSINCMHLKKLNRFE